MSRISEGALEMVSLEMLNTLFRSASAEMLFIVSPTIYVSNSLLPARKASLVFCVFRYLDSLSERESFLYRTIVFLFVKDYLVPQNILRFDQVSLWDMTGYRIPELQAHFAA